MGKSVVTAQDIAQAERLLKILGCPDVSPYRVKSLAMELAFMRETAVTCAAVRVEQELSAASRAKKSTSKAGGGNPQG